jgi:signal transduction histidine kinase
VEADRPVRWGWFLAVAAGVAALATLMLLHDPTRSPLGQVAIMGAATAANLAASGLWWATYRDSHDPHALFISSGFLVLGVQALAFGALWPVFDDRVPSLPTPVYGWKAGWLVAAICFSMAYPWWDRRGRPPIRPRLVLVTAGASLIVFDAVILILSLAGDSPSPLPGAESPLASGDPGGGMVSAVATSVLLVVAAVREVRAGRDGRADHAWLASAFLLAVAIQASTFLRPTTGRGLVQWLDAPTLAVPVLAFIAVLAGHRAELSRMRRASDRADAVMDGRAEIATMVAHELRGPVSAIKGLAATTSQSYERLSDAERREFVELMDQEAGRLLVVVDQTSLALKIDAGTLVTDIRQQDVSVAVREGVDAAAIRGRRVEVLGEAGISAPIDRRWISEVVRQLVQNAAKFSPEGAPVSVRVRRDQSDVLVEVIDQGPGIPPEHRREVFERFAGWRPVGYEDRAGGGLGLFIARGIVEQHSGSISIQDGPGGGTMLRVRLPLEVRVDA